MTFKLQELINVEEAFYSLDLVGRFLPTTGSKVVLPESLSEEYHITQELQYFVNNKLSLYRVPRYLHCHVLFYVDRELHKVCIDLDWSAT